MRFTILTSQNNTHSGRIYIYAFKGLNIYAKINVIAVSIVIRGLKGDSSGVHSLDEGEGGLLQNLEVLGEGSYFSNFNLYAPSFIKSDYRVFCEPKQYINVIQKLRICPMERKSG